MVAHEGVHPLALQLNGGYARRLRSGVTLDAGALHSIYSYHARGYETSDTEIYAGAAYKFLSSRIYYSPHYFGSGFQSVYGELDANFSPAKHLNFNAHVGLLGWLHTPDDGYHYRTEQDWRIGATREFGRLAVHADLSGGGPGKDYYDNYPHERTWLVFGISYAL